MMMSLVCCTCACSGSTSWC